MFFQYNLQRGVIHRKLIRIQNHTEYYFFLVGINILPIYLFEVSVIFLFCCTSNEGGRENWTVNNTCTQSFIIKT